VFCPNCGTQNESAATPCTKCGFKLSGISVPKFKGTMMLNSDQTVQELIEEHRRKAQGAAAEKIKGRVSEPAPKRVPGSSAPPSSLGPRGPVLQPPRAAAPTRGRMGGTMMGVAPQAGGVMPPAGARAPAAPLRTAPVAPPEVEPGRGDARAPGITARPEEHQRALPDPGPADAWAGTAQLPQLDPGAADERPPQASAPALKATRPLEAVPSSDEPAFSDPADGERASADAAEAPEPVRARAVALTAPLPQQPDRTASADLAEAARAVPPRLRALDLVLIVCTFGLYGIVLWLRRRKPLAA
jgi:zinc ribbon protein